MILLRIAVVLLCYIRFVTPIRCYECTSSNNSMCLEPSQYDTETLRHFLRTTECQSGVYGFDQEQDQQYDFFCRKITQTILRKHYEPELRVTRGCGWRRHSKACYKADNEDHLETVCQCFTDGCNGAGSLTAGLSVGLTGVLLLLSK